MNSLINQLINEKTLKKHETNMKNAKKSKKYKKMLKTSPDGKCGTANPDDNNWN